MGRPRDAGRPYSKYTFATLGFQVTLQVTQCRAMLDDQHDRSYEGRKVGVTGATKVYRVYQLQCSIETYQEEHSLHKQALSPSLPPLQRSPQ